MKIITLLDNLTYKTGLSGEHGFSLYLQKDNIKILFDCGQSKKFIENANILGINISEIDLVILSHGHFDHTGGLKDFISINKKAKILLKKEALKEKYKNNKFIGFPFNPELFKERFIFLDKNYLIDDEAIVITDIKIYNKNDTHFKDFYIKENDNFSPDNFNDEIFLLIKINNKANIISGCSHRGITNIIENVKEMGIKEINSVIGGFHISEENYENILKIADYFTKNKVTKILASHCTGVESYAILKRELKDKISYNFTGNDILI
ncbi:MAG TPA: MBL fold metallo-hydrolase [Spirochaetota bacterium]|nr:MBL fold metallo-hydrolase [Spirochaetota bacterium]HOL56613.1 MBL fold metallo-hydrolase [Spirochaetota bacterium]HPP04041.1 MBL fold metallo-hydrolase [Spirochaetota bacterium]